jgi:hypothetical protein
MMVDNVVMTTGEEIATEKVEMEIEEIMMDNEKADKEFVSEVVVQETKKIGK